MQLLENKNIVHLVTIFIKACLFLIAGNSIGQSHREEHRADNCQ